MSPSWGVTPNCWTRVHISGDVSSVGGNLRRSSGAQVDGQVTRTGAGRALQLPPRPSIIEPTIPNWSMRLSPVFRLIVVWFPDPDAGGAGRAGRDLLA